MNRPPDLAINPLGDRIVHAFFSDGSSPSVWTISGLVDAADHSAENGELPAAGGHKVVHFPDFVRTLARFKPIENNAGKDKLNSREEKLRGAIR